MFANGWFFGIIPVFIFWFFFLYLPQKKHNESRMNKKRELLNLHLKKKIEKKREEINSKRDKTN